MKTSITYLALVLVVFAATASAQTVSPAMAAADKLLNQQDFTAAASAYEAILKNSPKNARALYQLATARYSLKQYKQAADAYLENISITGNPFAMYNVACVFSLMGQTENAVEWLQKTFDNPKAILASMNFADPDFTNIKTDARFIAIKEKVGRKIRPCAYMAEAKQLNFWVGEWDVYDPQGRKNGTSIVQNFANECGILENWTDVFGGDGKSINFYDSATGKWYQYWMGGNGAPLRYSGVFKDKALRYESETVAGGKKTLQRLTFFDVDPNTVRQLAESSADNGSSWSVNYDYKYVRRNK